MTEEREENEERGESPGEPPDEPGEPESTGDPELDRQVETLEAEGDRVGQGIEDAKRDWAAKQDDPGVSGATPAENGEDEGEE